MSFPFVTSVLLESDPLKTLPEDSRWAGGRVSVATVNPECISFFPESMIKYPGKKQLREERIPFDS